MSNDEEKLSGIAVDFWNLIKERANLKSSINIAKNWNDVLTKIKTKKS